MSAALRRALGIFVRTPLHPQWLIGRRVFPAALRRSAGVLLDIGAGDRWIEPCLPEGVRYSALDYPATGRDLYGGRPDALADAIRLPFRDASLDMVVSLEVIEHVWYLDAMLAEVARTLKSGGRAFLSMPFLYSVHDAPYDYQRWPPHGWSRSAEAVGLEVTTIEPTGNAIEAAALLGCLAITGPLQGKASWQVLLAIPVVIPVMLTVNLAGWALSCIWPAWNAMSFGLYVELRKP